MASDPNDPFGFGGVPGVPATWASIDPAWFTFSDPAPPADPTRCSKCDRELSSVLDACVYKTDDPTMCRDCR